MFMHSTFLFIGLGPKFLDTRCLTDHHETCTQVWCGVKPSNLLSKTSVLPLKIGGKTPKILPTTVNRKHITLKWLNTTNLGASPHGVLMQSLRKIDDAQKLHIGAKKLHISSNSTKFPAGQPLLPAYNFSATMAPISSTSCGGCGLRKIFADYKYALNCGKVAYSRLRNAWRAALVAIVLDNCYPYSYSPIRIENGQVRIYRRFFIFPTIISETWICRWEIVTDIQGVPKMTPKFVFVITSVNVHRF